MNGAASHRLLRWYPSAWRARYGDEMVALMQDTYGDDRVPWRQRWSLARRGLGERVHRLGRREPRPEDRVRNGSLWVLCGWAFFVLGGMAFGKLSEHWDQATAPGVRHLPAIGYNAVVTAAIVGLLVVLLAGALALPATVRLLRGGGWPEVRRPVLAAAAVVALTTVYSIGVAVWSLHLPDGRQSGSVGAVGVVWAVLVSCSIAALTAAAVAVARRLTLTARVVEAEGWLAVALAVVMVVVMAGTALWWGAIAADTAILSARGAGLFDSSGWLSIAAAASVMLVGLAVAVSGVVRLTPSLREVHAAR